MVKRHCVGLTGEEQGELKALVSKGRAAAYKQTHARILLLSDENQDGGPMKDEEIARALKVGTATVERVRRRCVEEGVEAALARREQLRRRQRKLDGQGEAHLIAMAISQPPEGRVSWTMHLLADRLVEREIVERAELRPCPGRAKATNWRMHPGMYTPWQGVPPGKRPVMHWWILPDGQHGPGALRRHHW